MSFQDWVAYLLKRLVWYMETPRHERKEAKMASRLPWSVRWFGMIPFSLKMYVDSRRPKSRRKA
ncbi:YqzE family protein [Staphylospora marina]|uniref:YqzE family protein n=1 Tax=Staphylospora marina TaxID=2490858 RepID=UPI000F5BF3C4|nr:YqzE family protein [Staphylospora marina]